MPASATFIDFSAHGTMPPSAREWLATHQDKPVQVKAEFLELKEDMKKWEEIAHTLVYEAREVHPLDLRFHLRMLSTAIAKAQDIAIQALLLRKQGDVPPDFFAMEIAILDGDISRLVARVNEWHGTIDSQPDIPDSLKLAFKEASHGEVIPFPEG